MFKKSGRLADPASVRVDVTFGDSTAKRARLAARSNDGDTLHALIAGTDDPHDRELLLYAAVDGIARAPWLDNLPARYPDSSAAWAIRGVHTYRNAWKGVGGEGRGAPRDEDLLARWREHLELADVDLMHAARLATDDDPVPWSFLVATGWGLGLSFKEICDRFDEADQRVQWMVLAHHHLMQAASPEGVGNDETMLAVAADITSRAPDGCACHDVIVFAHLDRARREPSTDEMPGMVAYLGRDDVRADLDRAARRSVESKRFEPRPEAIISRNFFAYAFVVAGEIDRARVQFERIGDRPSELPWGWDDPDPGLAFARARQRTGFVPADD